MLLLLGAIMARVVEIENIQEMRREAGIEDFELRKHIGLLRVGDCVKLTFLTGGSRPRTETILVRITRIQDGAYRGKLTDAPTLLEESKLRAGSIVTFKKDHIHSIAKEHFRR